MRVNPDPSKFYMCVAQGVKAEARADAPDVEVPFCIEHQRWPCMACGSKHFDDCECPFCVPELADPQESVREAAGYAASMLLGMERHWRRIDVKVADQLVRYSKSLRKFADGAL